LVDAEASITVQATCTVSKVSVPEGNFFDVHMDGLGYGAYTAEYEVLYDNHLTGYISGVTTNGSADVKVRAEGSGKHLLQVLGGGVDPVPYLNWQQSPYQWVPNFTFDVNVTKGNPKTVADGLPKLQASVGDKMTATPGLGHVGDTFTLGGTGLTPNKTYAVAWMTEDGNHVTAAGYHDGSISMGTVTTSSTGTFSVKLKAPDDLGGPAHTIQLLDGQTVVGSTTYRIYPSLFSAPKQVKQGQLFTVHLKGTGYTYFDNIYSVDYDNSWIGYGCGFNSHGDLQFQIHATGAPGIHYVDIYPTVYKGNQALPNPYVVPQLSYAADHPGDDLPAFHIAFTVTK
jgi:hypothetical protein